ncbi:MAG: dTDP-4-dehydrorhamnose 3,5-epimerase [Beijerinckiaceae bacterium]|nr:dTDP-4-dehydrorhamnose 3,5-epimerase [Beijerinckiaceae bacterium]MCZ8298779.1 dTDP-4-dehydrorhamnose 3,5-epimerase [Beijerinckiaceae bacterium]
MRVERLDLDGPVLFTPQRWGDDRGHFAEVFRQDVFEREVGVRRFVQDNHSVSRAKGTVRGLHFQRPPMAQGKLVRVSRGAVLDVIVDARASSPTYGRHLAIELSEENGHVLWVPEGFLHGFCTLTDNVDLLYKVTAFYSAPHDGAVRWNDPDLGISWPVDEASARLSAKDAAAPSFRDLGPVFV